jgi:membrane protein implicated in regulation of membrane protease activity
VLRNSIIGGSVTLIVLGFLHAVYVGQSDDIEPYLWLASVFLIVHGILTLIYMRRRRKRRSSYPA